MKLTPKLALVLISFATVLLLGVGALVYSSGRAALEAATFAELQSTSLEKSAALDDWIAERKSDVSALSRSPAILEKLEMVLQNGPDSTSASNRLIQELSIRTGPGQPYLALLILSPDVGEVLIATSAREEGKFREDRDYFIEGKTAPFVSKVYYSLELQAPAITASAPLRKEGGQLLGVLVGRLNLEKLNAIIQRRSGLRQTDDAFLVNTSNLFVTQPYLLPDPAVLQRGIHTQAVRRCLQTRSNGTLSTIDYRNIPSIITYRWLPEHELCLIVKMNRAEALAPIDAFGRTIVWIALATLIAASVLALVMSRSMIRPILAMQIAAQGYGRGQLDLRLPERHKDELGVLAREFNQMAAALEQKEGQLRDYAAQLEQKVEERTSEVQRTLEELKYTNAELEQFAYVASHDLQEPLRMVSSYMQLLARRYQGKLDHDADEFIAFAVDGAKRMQTLINDLLTLSRVGTRGKPLVLTSCADAIEEAISNLQIAIEESGAIITHESLPQVKGDLTQLVQLFQNLLSNAIKFRGSEPPRIHVGVRQVEREWVFQVCDNGIGIDPRFADRIFVIFQRLHDRASYPGTGIGLAICKRIVQRHGGHIWVESDTGKGATFYFTLPRKETT